MDANTVCQEPAARRRSLFVWASAALSMFLLVSSAQAGPLTDQLQGKVFPRPFFFARAWFEEVPVGVSMHTLKDHIGDPTVFVDVPPALQGDGPNWKWGGPNADDVGVITEFGNVAGNDSITVTTNIQHLVGPHMGEASPNPAIMPISLSVTGTDDGWDIDTDVSIVPHGGHVDYVIGLLGALSEDMDIKKYDLHVVGVHEGPAAPGEPPPVGYAYLAWEDPILIGGASVVWALSDGELQMVVGGASIEHLDVLTAAIVDQKGQILVDFTKDMEFGHESALLGDVQTQLSEEHAVALMNGELGIVIETSAGEFTGRMMPHGSETASDLTGDGLVDFEDLTILLANWDAMVGPAAGNIVNAEKTPVDFDDLTFLLADWTGSARDLAAAGRSHGTGQHVPEPSTICLILLGTLVAFGCRRRWMYK